MSGKCFVHIGLPKTATSTLQTDLFPSIASEFVDYIGVDGLRRVERETELYQKAVAAVNSGDGLDELRTMLAARLNSGVSLILSEELFTVSEGKVSWRKKLENLSRIVCALDYSLILTVREPAAALFSYYVELYPRFKDRFASFSECALRDDDMQIYHYRKLMDEIHRSFDRDRVHAFRFEDIIRNDVAGLIKIILPGSNCGYQFNLSIQNQRMQTNDFVHSRYNFTLLDLVRRVIVWLGIGHTQLFARLKNPLRPIIPHLGELVLKNLKVKRPSQEEMNRLKIALREETSALDEYFGIRYE